MLPSQCSKVRVAKEISTCGKADDGTSSDEDGEGDLGEGCGQHVLRGKAESIEAQVGLESPGSAHQ
mgnify:CR=1 FL=1